jgi:ABC-type cobalamin transport system permease subunit
MSTMGYVFFWVSIIAAIVMPFLYIDATKKVKNGEDTLFNKIALGICSGVILWTILMMIRPV